MVSVLFVIRFQLQMKKWSSSFHNNIQIGTGGTPNVHQILLTPGEKLTGA